MGDVAVGFIADQLQLRPTSGIATYARGVLQGLRALGREVTLVTARGPSVPTLGWPVRTSALPHPALVRLWGAGHGRRVVAAFDVVFAPSFVAPWGARPPVVVTVHDLAFREVPETFPRRGRRWHEAAFAAACRHAAHMIVPAERTAGLLVDAGVPGDRVTVIPEGCDHLPPADAAGAAALLDGLGVTTPYLLSVSTLEPRKNLERLIAAYELVRGRLPEPWPLVVVGPRGWGAALRPAPGVKLAGVVTDAVLAGLYAGARCLAYVPLTEGWGLPPVEAMAACTPVVASPMPSTGGAALEVDPLDVDAIAEGLVAAAGDDRRRSELATAGLLRAGELTWEAAARRHVEVWERCGSR